MPSEDDDLMDTDRAFDAMIDRIMARDATPGPCEGFVRSTEGVLMDSERFTARIVLNPHAKITKPLLRRGQPLGAPTLSPPQRAGRIANLMAACLIVIALGAGGLGIRRLGIGSTPDPAMIAAVSSLATPNPNATPYADSLLALPSRLVACTVAPRPDGYVDTMLAQTSWYVPKQLPVQRSGNFAVLDGDYLTLGDEGDPAVPSEVTDGLNQTLLQLWACQIYDRRGDFQQYADPDDRSWAVYSDNFLRRSFRQGWIAEGEDPKSGLWGLSVPQAAPIEVVTTWDVHDFDVPRVAATVRYDSFRMDPLGIRWLVFFVQEGDRWLIDEFAPATFDNQVLNDPNLPHLVEPLDLVIHDVVLGETPRNEGSITYLRDYTDYYTGGGLLLRVHNLGLVPHRVEIPGLSIAITVAPGTSQQLIVDAPSGTNVIELSVFQGDADEPDVVGSLAFIEPGQPHARG